MKKTIKFDKLKFEPVSTSQSNSIMGGFSISVSLNPTGTDLNTGETNNCLGGNCTYACSNQQNDKCNAHAGCG